MNLRAISGTMTRMTRTAAVALAVALFSCASGRAAEIFTLYSDFYSCPTGMTLSEWSDGGTGVFSSASSALDAPEASLSYKTSHTSWAGWGIFYPATQDLTRFAGGNLRFWIYSSTGDVKVEIEKAGSVKASRLITSYGWTNADKNRWKLIDMPLNDFGVTFEDVRSPFEISLNSAGTMYVDYVRWTKGVTLDTLYVEARHRATHVAVSSVTWTPAELPSGWNPADVYLKIDFDPGTTYWAIRVGTDNTEAGASPRYGGDGNPCGLLCSTAAVTSANPLPVSWTVEDSTRTVDILGTGAPETWITGGGAYKWLQDVSFSFDGAYGSAWTDLGIEWGTWNGQRGWKNSPNYIYFGANFENARAGRTYKTNRLILELYYE